MAHSCRRRHHGAGSATAAGKLVVMARPMDACVRPRCARVYRLRVARLRKEGKVEGLLQRMLLEEESFGRPAKRVPPLHLSYLTHVLRGSLPARRRLPRLLHVPQLPGIPSKLKKTGAKVGVQQKKTGAKVGVKKTGAKVGVQQKKTNAKVGV